MTGIYALPGTGPRPALQMASGMVVDIENPDPETITLPDIAHALSYICRFGGHVRKYYSVAQHSIHVAAIAVGLAQAEGHPDPEFYRLSGLLHDASEGILGCDIPTPLKRYPGLESFVHLQDVHMAAIAERFDLPKGFDKDPILKRADVIAFAVEARDLMGDPEWARVEVSLRDRIEKIIPMSPDLARVAYLLELNRALDAANLLQ